jgi:ferric-dicitrate binding protein FerR (iron transport regulator)
MKEKNISDSLSEAIEGYITNKLTQSQADELLEWLGKNEENKQYLLELRKIWYASSQLSYKGKDADRAWAKLSDILEDNEIRPMPKPVLRVPVFILYRVAAAVLLLGILGIGSVFVFWHPNSKSDSAYFEALAPKGSRSVITLADGSIVWLNSGTKLRYQRNFGQENRDLYLEGEAYFVVAENKQVPFIVKTPDISVTATGTAFNVKAYMEENVVETTLEKGEVRIETLNKSKNKPESITVILKPNQKAVFVKTSKNFSVNQPQQKNETVSNASDVKKKIMALSIDSIVDTKLSTSWKDNRWIFRSEKLINLRPILERRYDISIIFRDSVLTSYKFTGTIKEESLEQVLKAICLASPIRYEINHNQVQFFEDSNLKNQYQRPLKPN